MRFFAVLPSTLLALVGTVGCIGDDEAVVFVDPSIVNPSASVSEVALGVSISGSFQLTLNLGPRASGPSKVSLGAFSIRSADETKSIGDPLEVTSSTVFPVEVPVDGDVMVDFTFGTGAKTWLPDTKADLCIPGGIRIAGQIQDSLQSGQTPVESAVFQPSGCM